MFLVMSFSVSRDTHRVNPSRTQGIRKTKHRRWGMAHGGNAPRTKLALAALLCFAVLACSASSDHPADGGAPRLTDSSPNVPPDGAPVTGTIGGAELVAERTSAFHVTSKNETDILVELGRGQSSPPAERLKLSFIGAAASTYECGAAGSARLSYETTSGTYATTNDASVTPCRITVTTYGAVGEHLTGTFSGTLIGTSLVGSAPARMEASSGAFDVVRAPDAP